MENLIQEYLSIPDPKQTLIDFLTEKLDSPPSANEILRLKKQYFTIQINQLGETVDETLSLIQEKRDKMFNIIEKWRKRRESESRRVFRRQRKKGRSEEKALRRAIEEIGKQSERELLKTFEKAFKLSEKAVLLLESKKFEEIIHEDENLRIYGELVRLREKYN